MRSTYDDTAATAYLQAVALGLQSPDFQTQVEPGMPRQQSAPSDQMNAIVGMMDARRALTLLARTDPVQHGYAVLYLQDPDAPDVNLHEAYEGLKLAQAFMNGVI